MQRLNCTEMLKKYYVKSSKKKNYVRFSFILSISLFYSDTVNQSKMSISSLITRIYTKTLLDFKCTLKSRTFIYFDEKTHIHIVGSRTPTILLSCLLLFPFTLKSVRKKKGTEMH